MTPDPLIKIKHLLEKISAERKEKVLTAVLSHSEFKFKKKPFGETFFDIEVLVEPEIFTEFFDVQKSIERDLSQRIEAISNLNVEKIRVIPDYSKLEVFDLEVEPVYTEWEEINLIQRKLIQLLEKGRDHLDYQAIGNTSRILMNKLSLEVFDPAKHIPKEKDLDLSSGKFKNRLNTFISSELGGRENKELRGVAKSSIDLVGHSIDLMNSTTHKLNAQRHYAEVCVITCLSSVSIIKMIFSLNRIDE